MRVIFLDMDGVINSEDCYRGNTEVRDPITWFAIYSKDLVSNVNTLCREFDYKIVASSSWRLDASLEYLKSIYRAIGLDSERLVGLTPDLSGNGSYYLFRYEEIQQYLKEHPEVEHYLILDDDSRAKLTEHPERFIQCDFGTGFDRQTLEKARAVSKEMLSGVEPGD